MGCIVSNLPRILTHNHFVDCDTVIFRRYPKVSVGTKEEFELYIKEREEIMDKKIKGAQKHIEKVEKKEFKGLLKEDHKLDAKRDKLEAEVKKKKK
jgi:hypothetical protein